MIEFDDKFSKCCKEDKNNVNNVFIHIIDFYNLYFIIPTKRIKKISRVVLFNGELTIVTLKAYYRNKF